MTEQSELLKEFQETKDKYEKLIAKKGKLLLTEMFKAIFAACPEIKKITWDQYAPHFNDGDPCTFDVHERRFFVEGGECDEDDKYEWAEASSYDPSDSYFKQYIEGALHPWTSGAGMLNSEQEHPSQPIGFDSNGTIRFKKNEIVDFLLEHSSVDLNRLWLMLYKKQFSVDDMIQFYQLIGYSVSGFGDVFNKQEDTYSEDGNTCTWVPEPGFERAVALVQQYDAEAEKLWRSKQEYASGTNAEDDCG